MGDVEGEGGKMWEATRREGKSSEDCFLFMEKAAVKIKAGKGDKQPDTTPSAHGFGKIRLHLQQYTGERNRPDYQYTKNYDRKNHRCEYVSPIILSPRRALDDHVTPDATAVT
jgi:hypothetical protein